MRTATALLAAAALALAGCASDPIEPSYYLLRPAEKLQSRTLTPSEDFALGRIAIAPYIDQRGLVLETETGEVRPARQHLWAEPVYEGVQSYLRVAISAALGKDLFPLEFKPDATAVELRIDQLHGTADGRARLVAYWWLRRDNELIAAYQFAESRTLTRDGYDALAEAQRALLMQLAQAIARTLVPPA